MHYYPHHIGDFIKDTSNLDDHQCMTYLRLCWKYYLDETPLSGDCEDIAFAVRSDEKTVRLLLKHYFKFDDGCWRQKRIDREISAYQAKSQKAKASAKARWNNANVMQTECKRNANALKKDANEPKNDANQEPRTKNHIKGALNECAWSDWIEYRKARKLAKYTTERIQNQLSELTHDQQQACVDHSITKNYNGLFPEKFKSTNLRSLSDAELLKLADGLHTQGKSRNEIIAMLESRK